MAKALDSRSFFNSPTLLPAGFLAIHIASSYTQYDKLGVYALLMSFPGKVG
ncbi:hypothetical protein [Thalassoporum mexicanum]|uniref:hypothetical protein n=1 Tax=Thalassoporum mexicanum TaxID=3457544 RepID=UPI0030DA578F